MSHRHCTRYRTTTTSSVVYDRRLNSAWPSITGYADIAPVIVQLTEDSDSFIAQLPIWHRQHNVQTTSLYVSLTLVRGDKDCGCRVLLTHVSLTLHDSDSDSLLTKFYNKESVSKAVSIQTQANDNTDVHQLA